MTDSASARSPAAVEACAPTDVFRVVLAYAVVAGLWILLSDKAVAWLSSDPAMITLLGTMKGWLFVAVTSLLLYGLMRRLVDRVLTVSRRELEAQMERARALQLLEAIVENSEDAIIGKNLDGIITAWNRGAEKMFGYTAAEVIGRSIDTIVPPSRRNEEAETLATLRRGEAIRHFETQRMPKDGSRLDVSMAVSPIRDTQGRLVGASKIARDITEKKLAEAVIRELNSSLEQKVGERTAELRAANQELEAFAYSVSHDLRAPLRAIDGFSRKLLTGYADRLDDEGRRQLQVVRDNAQRMGRLIDDLLGFSRMGRREMDRQSIDMEAMALGLIDELRAAEPQRAIEFALLPPLPRAGGDAAMLRQVWANLLGNAAKFTRRHPAARIEVGGRTEGGEAIYWVKDDGAGFDMQYAGKLFGVFQRLHRQDEFEGTGVGLAIAQRILHRHNGRIWGEGKPEAGATFWFALPLPSPVEDFSGEPAP